ncbi:MAG: hypothetical protein QM778_07715 [Myxococcales bacterium]
MRRLAYLAFFLSGASSLIFQTLWTRMLHHTFGATSVAMSSVLTAFMAGLGLGAHLFGKRAARMKRPLVAYALCELGVAACALVIPELVRADGFLADINSSLRATLGEGSLGFMLARFGCVFPILIVPTTLMGGSLPLLAQHFVRGSDDSASLSAEVGTLYAVNTFGAVAGTVAGSFLLMPAFGVQLTNWFAVGINALLGVGIVTVFSVRAGAARGAPAAAAEAGAAPDAAREPASVPHPSSMLGRKLALWGFAISGACAMTYEVVWSRALSMAIGSSMQAFALILVTFLVGIALGSAVASRLLLLPTLSSAALTLWGLVTCALSLLALAPCFALASAALASTIWLCLCASIGIYLTLAFRRAAQLEAADDELEREAESVRLDAAERVLLLPCATSLVSLAYFTLRHSQLPAVSVHGYLPHVTGSVVLCVAGLLWLLLRLRNASWLLAGSIQLSIAISTFASYLFQDEIPYGFARLVSSLGSLSDHVGTVRFFMLLSAGLCTLPATLGMGAMFPVTLELARRGQRNALGQDVGNVYAANTLGSIAGSWLPGFVLLPRLGMEPTLRLAMLLNAVMALVMLGSAPERGTAKRLLSGLAALAAAGLMTLLILGRTPLDWDLSHMTLGAFRVSLAREVLDPTSWGQPDLVYYRDGVSTTVSVERWGRHLSLKNNGKVDASNGDDMPTQIMVSAYPLLLHPKGPRGLDVAIVGFGSGVTVGAALEFPVRHVEAMELEEAVVEAGVEYFSDVSHLSRKSARFPYVRHPRLTLHNDDGRNFLASTKAHYDVIVSEPSNPWITGVSDLFTVDHFQLTKRRLKPGGVYCQWVQLYEMSPENIKTIYRTFASQFRYVLAFAAEELSSDTILVGSDSPLPLDLDHVARSMAIPSVNAELERAYVHSAYDVWSRILFASREELMQFTQREERLSKGHWQEVMRATGGAPCEPSNCRRVPARLNTDDNMLIELRAPSDLIGFSRYEGYLSVFYGEDWPYAQLERSLRGAESSADKVAMALSLLAHGRKRDARTYVRSLPSAPPPELEADVRAAQFLLGDLPEPQPDIEPPLPSPQLDPAARRTFDLSYVEIERALQNGNPKLALAIFERLPTLLRTLSGPSFRFLHALVLLRAAGSDRALLKESVLEFEDLIRKDETYARAHPELYYFLARAQERASNYDKSVRNMRAFAVQTAPN